MAFGAFDTRSTRSHSDAPAEALTAVAAIGAEWSIRSRRGAGTSVVVRIPKQASA